MTKFAEEKIIWMDGESARQVIIHCHEGSAPTIYIQNMTTCNYSCPEWLDKELLTTLITVIGNIVSSG